MAKVTVYVTDDQLEKLKAVKGFGRGGISKMFQAFVESATTGDSEPVGRYDYARKLMPTHAAIERHRRRLARKVQTGGPPADGGPVSAALTVLLYRRLIESDPSLAATFEKEFARFGLDELVAGETEGVDLLAEPDESEEFEEGDEFDLGGFGNLGNLGLRIGDEVREALRQVQAVKMGLRDLQGTTDDAVRRVPGGPRGGGPRGGGPRGGRDRHRGRRRLVVEVSADDDPRDVLSVSDFTTFTSRHPEWDAGARLSPSQMETVRELLIRRAGGDPEAEGDEVEIEVDVTTTSESSAEDAAEADTGADE